MAINKYQIVIEAPGDTHVDSLADIFGPFKTWLDVKQLSQQQMPSTRTYNGKMLIHMEIKQAKKAALGIQLIAGALSSATGSVWTIVHAQDPHATPKYTPEGDPVLDDDGNHVTSLVPDIQMLEADFINYMVDEYDADGNVVRPTVAAPHKYAGASALILG